MNRVIDRSCGNFVICRGAIKLSAVDSAPTIRLIFEFGLSNPRPLECHYSQPFQGFPFLEEISSFLDH